MTRAQPRQGVDCPIGLFEPAEREIETITAAINRASTAIEKAPFAADLRKAAGTLLACMAYDANNANCVLCREFSVLRDSTALLIEKAARLARRKVPRRPLGSTSDD